MLNIEREKIKIYIEDLLKENNTLFAMNQDIQERRKALKNELLLLCDSYGSEEDMKKMGALCGRLIGLAMVYRQNRKDISKNLALIQGLKNELKEI